MSIQLHRMQGGEIVSHIECCAEPEDSLNYVSETMDFKTVLARDCACWNGSKIIGPIEASPYGSTCQICQGDTIGQEEKCEMIESDRSFEFPKSIARRVWRFLVIL